MEFFLVLRVDRETLETTMGQDFSKSMIEKLSEHMRNTGTVNSIYFNPIKADATVIAFESIDSLGDMIVLEKEHFPTEISNLIEMENEDVDAHA
jgi:hypothetical protein